MIVALQGGLANQLWQYAFGISVAKARGEYVYFTRNRVDADVKRSYSLGFLQEPVWFVEKESENKFYDSGPFNPGVYAAGPNTTFIGYWQSSRYFDEPFVRAHTNFHFGLSDETMRVAEEINAVGSKSVFLHVRRGDYVKEKHTAEFHGNLTLAYYEKAIAHVRSFVADPKFFVFSDDPEWCQFLGFPVISHNKPGNGTATGREYEDLFLMSLCHHAIIANSAFSWWGAFAGDVQQGRVVVAPKQWFANPDANSADIVPDRWIKI